MFNRISLFIMLKSNEKHVFFFFFSLPSFVLMNESTYGLLTLANSFTHGDNKSGWKRKCKQSLIEGEKQNQWE